MTLRAGVLARRGPVVLLLGMFLATLLGALVPGMRGAVVGSVVLGGGWVLLGLDLRRAVTG